MAPRKRVPRRRARKPSTKVSKTFVKKVQKIIHADAEDKYRASYIGQLDQAIPLPQRSGPGSAGVPVLNQPYTFLPLVEGGSGINQRVGNKIRAKSLVIDWQISLNPDSTYQTPTNSIPLMVRLLVLKDKSVSDNTLTSLNTLPGFNLLAFGNDNYGGATFNPVDLSLRVNRQKYSVITDKIMKLEKGQGGDPQSANGFSGTVVFNSPSSVHKFRTRIPCKNKELIYTANTASYPSNFAPFFTVLWAQCNGDVTSPPTTYMTDKVLVHYTCHFDFEDS